jgi:hypothetical protein
MKKSNVSNEDLLKLERSLKYTLKPVDPDYKFIGSLRKALKEEANEDRSHRIAFSFLTIAAGLITGLTIILIGQILVKKNAVKQ